MVKGLVRTDADLIHPPCTIRQWRRHATCQRQPLGHIHHLLRLRCELGHIRAGTTTVLVGATRRLARRGGHARRSSSTERTRSLAAIDRRGGSRATAPRRARRRAVASMRRDHRGALSMCDSSDRACICWSMRDRRRRIVISRVASSSVATRRIRIDQDLHYRYTEYVANATKSFFSTDMLECMQYSVPYRVCPSMHCCINDNLIT